MSDSEWMTVSEASEKLNIPVETIRRYIRSHSVHLKVKKQGKKYSIHDDSLMTVRRIRELYMKNKNVEEVEEELSVSGVPMTFTVKNDDDSMMTVNVVTELAQIKKALHEQQEFNQNLLYEFKKQGEQLSQLVDVVCQDKKLIEENRDLLELISDNHQAEIEVASTEQKKLGFFSRWFK